MIAKGTWRGQYKYDNDAHQRLTGFEATNFEIEITAADDEIFSGTVRDDLATGGTKGIGEINGTLNGHIVEFVKQMPVRTILVGRNGERKTFDEKHRPIYYTGTLSEDGKAIAGQWKFKPGFITVAIMFILGVKNSGTWFMRLKG